MENSGGEKKSEQNQKIPKNIYNSKLYKDELKCFINNSLGIGMKQAIFKLFKDGLFDDDESRNKNSLNEIKLLKENLFLYEFSGEKLGYYLKLFHTKWFGPEEPDCLKKGITEENVKSSSEGFESSNSIKSSGSKNSKTEKKTVEDPFDTINNIIRCPDDENEIEIDCLFRKVNGRRLKDIMLNYLDNDGKEIEEDKTYFLIVEVCLDLSTQWISKLEQISKLSSLIFNLKKLHPEENFLLFLICNSNKTKFNNQINLMKQNYLVDFKKILEDEKFMLFFPLFLNLQEISEWKESEKNNDKANIDKMQTMINQLIIQLKAQKDDFKNQLKAQKDDFENQLKAQQDEINCLKAQSQPQSIQPNHNNQIELYSQINNNNLQEFESKAKDDNDK